MSKTLAFVTRLLAEIQINQAIEPLLRVPGHGALDVLLDEDNPKHTSHVSWLAYRYCHYIVCGPDAEAEELVLMTPVAAYNYATYVVKGRWARFEEIALASTDPATAQPIVDYTRFILREPWPDGRKWLHDMATERESVSTLLDIYDSFVRRNRVPRTAWQTDLGRPQG